MQKTDSIAQIRAILNGLPHPLGFVPTMGALHAGHIELATTARAQCAAVAASVFVNPLQFGANEDLDRYPRDLEGDAAKLATAGVDVLFAPTPDVMYPSGFTTTIDAGNIGTQYEGAVRPTHFRGVATVVAKLLNVVRPDVLFLGQKDAQQTAVLRKMIRDLEFPIRVEIVPTVREPDGLAMSSRNAYLNAGQREAAPSLHRALSALRDALANGASKTAAVAEAHHVLSPQAEADYFDVVNADTFEPIERLDPPAFVIGAARFGTTRLLDNLWIRN